MDELSELTSPPVPTQGKQRSNQDVEIKVFNCTKAFVPILFIQRALIKSGATCPLKLILKGHEAYSAHYTTLMVNNPVIKEVDSHMELLEKWLMCVLFGNVPSSIFDAKFGRYQTN